MDNFYIGLKQNLDNIDYIKQNIDSFNDLSDEDIKTLFEDEEISFDLKEILANMCYKRINMLPFSIFMTVLFYIENSKIFITNYGNKINCLSYAELITLIYEGSLNNECLLEIIKLPCFQNYLSQEQEQKTSNKLQAFKIASEIYLIDNVDDLNLIGTKINDLLQSSPDSFEDVEDIIDSFLDKIIDHYEEISFENDINTVVIALMNYYIKNHKQLSDKLTKFYILFRLKDLGLQSCCENVDITQQDSDVFGYYQASSKALRIFSNYLKKKFEPFFKEYNISDENNINDFLNLLGLFMISHELGHIVRANEYDKFIDSVLPEQVYEQMKENAELYYWYKNGILRLVSPEKKYDEFHNCFIEETRADLFAIFDSNSQINKYFKNSFSEIQLQRNCKNNAERIIEMYTERNEGVTRIVTPMQKFDNFFKQLLPLEESLSISQKINMNDDVDAIFNNLLLGDCIPDYVLESILKIANGQVVTDDIYATVFAPLIKVRESDEDKKHK